MGLLELLQRDAVEAFNATRSPRAKPDFFAADLARRELAGVDLTSANLSKADLTGTDLSDAQLVDADLSGIDGTGLKLCNAIGLRVRLKGAFLEEADLTGCDLTKGDLAEANLVRTKGEGMRLLKARLRDADCTDAVWPEADLSECNLHKAVLIRADLTRADLTEAVAADADLTGAKLDGVVAPGAKLPGAKLVGASLVGARLDGASLVGADLTGADLSSVDLSRANLSGAKLTGAKLKGACLANAVLDGVELSGLDLDGVDLSGLDPRALGLSSTQTEALVASGSAVDPTTKAKVERPSVARFGKKVALLWLNAEGEEKKSVRYAILGGGTATSGVLPVGAEGVLAWSVAALPDGFELLLFQDRPGGVALVRTKVGADGVPAAARSESLGWAPLVDPIVRRGADGVLRLWGLARRGPTLVVQRLLDSGLELLHSQALPTARGFLNRHDPAVECKGGVVIPVGPTSSGRPVRVPEGFPGAAGTVVPVGAALASVWWEPRAGRERPGALWTAPLGGRTAPRPERVRLVESLRALDALGHEKGPIVAWLEGAEAKPWVARLPDQTGAPVPWTGPTPTSLRLVPDSGGGQPALLLGLPDGGVAAIDLSGEPLGILGV